MSTPYSNEQLQVVRLHGHNRAFVKMGSGPVILLIHGIGSQHKTWLPVMRILAENYTVLAPDLLGHGASDKPRADYSIGGYANGIRDLLAVLGIDKVTVVGHSLGGGVAKQFAYQYPQRTERLVLVGSGGLGPEVNPLLPVLTVPGASLLMGVATSPPVRPIAIGLMTALHRTGLPYTADAYQLALVYRSLESRESRKAFRHVLRQIIDWRGQIVTMRDRAYLAAYMPAMIVWGGKDTVIPVSHAFVAHEMLPSSRLEIFPNCGHFPHAEEPEHFAEILDDFISTTVPARYDARRWTRALKHGGKLVEAPDHATSPGPGTRPNSEPTVVSDDSHPESSRARVKSESKAPTGRQRRAIDGAAG